MLTCPKCHSTLVRCQNEFGNFWHCGECDGTALTAPLLRRFVDRETYNKLWQGSRQFEHPRKYECPGCNNRMEEVPIDLPVGVRHIDICDRCHFVWLDAGEWSDLPNAPAEESTERNAYQGLSPETRERIAVERIRKIRRDADEGSKDYGLIGSDEWWHWIPGLLRMPVEEEQPTIGALPLATWGIGVLIFLVSLLGFVFPNEAIDGFGLIPAEWQRMGGATLLTSFFLHGGWFHLLGNLYFLVVFGDNVEHFLGPLKFVGLLLLTTLCGDLLHILIDPSSKEPCIGASGGISGVMAFYALSFPRARIAVLLIYFFRGGWLRLGAIWMFGLWLLMQLLIIFQQANGMSSVSGAAHLGGALAGAFFWWLWRKRPECQLRY